MSGKREKIGFTGFLIITVLMLIGGISAFAENISLANAGKNKKDVSEILSVIDSYQENYFAIIKRNDMLLRWENDKVLNEDMKDLDKLFKKAKKQVKNRYYLKKYKSIQKRYKECDEITDIGMQEFSAKNYSEIDNLLNEVYAQVKSKISPEDFKNLVRSEAKWIKEVEDYGKVLDSMDYGTIRILIHYDYQINVKEFRTLLLMMYL